jgi:hypothetical protein
VRVVGGEEEPVRDPVAATEGDVHAGEQEPAEEELLPKNGVEEREDDDECEPAPVAAQETSRHVPADQASAIFCGDVSQAPVIRPSQRRSQLVPSGPRATYVPSLQAETLTS